MKMRFLPVIGVVLTTCGVMVGQQSQLRGPVAGFVFDASARVLRPIQGVPGASLLGDPIKFGFDLAAAYVAPAQDAAFVVASDETLHLFRIASDGVAEVGLGGLSGIPQSIVFSPSGTAAALFAMGRVRVLVGLPNNPSLLGSLNVPASAEPQAVTRGDRPPARTVGGPLAISDDGKYLLTVSGGSARLLSIQGENRALTTAHAGALVAFAPGGHDAAVMDPEGGLSLVRDAAGSGVAELLSAPDEGLAQAAGLAFSQDKQTLYVASASAHAVAAFHLSGGSRSSIECDCSPAGLVPMGNVFRLNEVGNAPLWLLDGAGNTPRTVFVPARVE